MKHIQIIENFNLAGEISAEKDKQAREIFSGERRQLMEIKLINSAVLSKHKAKEPITIFCLAGNGVFRAGENLEDECRLAAGTLLTLEGGIEHEVVAEPDLHLLLTKFKEN